MLGSIDILISLEARHAENIISGVKRVELRRRAMRSVDGATVWFYVKKPLGCVVGCARVAGTYSASPNTVWRKFGKVSGLSRREFLLYFEGVSTASVLLLESPECIDGKISLEEIRGVLPSFHPPQFYCRLDGDSPLRKLLRKQG